MSELKTYDELSKILKIHPGSLRRLVAQKKIPCHRIGGSIRFTEEDLEKILEPAGSLAEAVG